MRHYDEPANGWQEPDRRDGRGNPRGQQRSRLMLASGITAAVVALTLVGGSLYAYARYRSVWDSIKRVDVSSDINGIKNEPPADPHAVNILLIGSDSRKGVNGKIGGQDQGQRSDTVMVLHIAPGAGRATVLSFPRDSVVPVYGCTAEKGSPGQNEDTEQVEQINSTFSNGGPGCLMKTIIEQTHIHVDDFVELTFIGFEKVIDDLHGVNVCLPAAVNDPMSGLKLKAGLHHIYGGQALAFWRTREDLGMGSDLQRIQRDQFLMAALLQGIEKSGLLTSPGKLSSVIGDVAKNMTTDTGLDQSRMLTIAEGARDLASKNVQFIQVPTMTYSGNPNWVQFTPDATELFSAIAHDTKLPGTAKKAPGATLTSVKPDQVKVEVLNGSGIDQQAAGAASALSERGFNVTGTGPANNFDYTKSVVEYASAADKPSAELVKSKISQVEILHNPSLTPGTIELILGSTFTALKTTSSKSSDLTQTFGGITGDTKICKDQSAFSGPDGE